MATADEVLAAQGVEPGFVGPVPTPLPVFADEVLRLGHYVAGANKAGFHRSGVTLEQVPQATFTDLRDARPGDPCAQCSGDLEGARVIEVGNIFQLGLKYSVPMGATFLDEDGKERPIVMGSYGIGLARIAAAAVEQHHDGNGICWPASIAPFHVHLVLVRASDELQRELADDLYSKLSAEGFEVVYDDRDMSPGIKFKDADLLGCPAQVVVGKRAAEGFVELKGRAAASGATWPSRTSPPRCGAARAGLSAAAERQSVACPDNMDTVASQVSSAFRAIQGSAMGAMYTTPITKNRFSQDRFPIALKGLMDERQLSYRQLAYKTKLSAGYLNHLTKGTRPVPADPVIAVIAEALRVEPDFFLEFRLRQVADVLDGSPALADKLYGILLRHQPVPEDIAEALQSTTGGNGGNGGNGHGERETAVVGF